MGAAGRQGALVMAYVPDYDHDVFVSYARLDDQGESAWVSNLVRHLDTEMRQRLGTKDLRIWIDHRLDGNNPLTPEIMGAIRQSATLLCRQAIPPQSGASRSATRF
jgi:hypothetical protein